MRKICVEKENVALQGENGNLELKKRTGEKEKTGLSPDPKKQVLSQEEIGDSKGIMA